MSQLQRSVWTKIALNDLNPEEKEIKVWMEMMNHRDVVGENAKVAMSKYFFTKNKKKRGRHLLHKALVTKTGWKCAYFILKRSEILTMINNDENIRWVTALFEEKFSQSKDKQTDENDLVIQ